MIVKKILLLMAAAGAFLAAGVAIVVALALALYALIEPLIGPAGAAASVAGVAALLLILTGLSAAGVLRIGRREPSMAERVAEMIRDKPLSALAAAAAAGFFAMRNPQVLAELLKILLEPKKGKR